MKGRVKLSWFLVPIYFLLFIILIKWTIKLYSPDLNLSEDELKAFKASGKVKTDDFKLYEPNLADFSYTVMYGNAEENKEKEKKYIKTEKDKNIQTQTAQEEKKPPDVLASVKPSKQIEDIKAKEMMSIGYKKGFLSKVIGSIIDNPKALKAVFDNEYVVKGFLSRDIVKRSLSDPKFLESVLLDQKRLSNFLNNENVKAILNNQQALNAIAQSKMINEIMNSPAVSHLINNPQMITSILQNNPEIGNLISNPNIIQTLSKDPRGLQILSNITPKK